MPNDETLLCRLERAWQSLAGLAVGDAFGERFFMVADVSEEIRARVPPEPPWIWTDDTAMARSLVRCLDIHAEIVPNTLARLFAEEYARDPYRGYGGMAHSILRQIGRGVSWEKAAGSAFDGMGSYGNGGAMRAAPVGAYFAGNIRQVLEQARLSAMVTHAHAEGQAGAMAVAAAAAWAAQTESLDGREMLEWVRSHTPEGDTRSGLLQALAFSFESAPEEAAEALGSGQQVSAQDTVPFALWCAARHLDSYPEALWATVSGLGDLDTTCAIVGGIVVLCAREGIPADWRSATEAL
ncbi:MAG: ADP-ribosylglycohydrolase family protein [Armatimonadetes bacterium]|nr:ADP-ribosylglycohydrolase family protein [Armatimonadota bacterium]